MSKNREPSPSLRCADFVLAGGAVISLFAGFYFLWRHPLGLEEQMSAMFWFALPFVAAMLLALSLRLRLTLRLQIACGLLLIGGVAYAVEFFQTPLKPVWVGVTERNRDEVVRIAKRFSIAFDTRSEEEVTADLRNRGNDAVPLVLTGLSVLKKQSDESLHSVIRANGTELMALGGIANRLTVMCNQSGEYMTYLSDERGFHNPRGLWSASGLKIVALGNSFTHGFCVPSEKNFVALIRERHPATLNLGMAGDGPLLMLATVTEYLTSLRPERVLWFYFEGNQLADLDHEKSAPLLMRYLDDGFNQALSGRQNEIDRALTRYLEKRRAEGQARDSGDDKRGSELDGWLRKIKLTGLRQRAGLIRETGAQQPIEAGPLPRQNVDLLHEIVLRTKNRVAAWGGNLYFVYLPTWWRYANSDDVERIELERRQVLTVVQSLEIPLIDTLHAFEAHRDPLSLFPLRRFYHYNEDGHRLVGHEVLRALTAQG